MPESVLRKDWHQFYNTLSEFELENFKTRINMLLTKYNHRNFEPVGFGSLVDRFFNDGFFPGERLATDKATNFTPKVDVIETKENFEIQFSLPGLEKDAIDINLENGKLTVSGERKLEEKKEDRNYKSLESYFGTFKRAFHLPENIDEEQIKASHKNGILSIEIPKVEPKSNVKQIAIK